MLDSTATTERWAFFYGLILLSSVVFGRDNKKNVANCALFEDCTIQSARNTTELKTKPNVTLRLTRVPFLQLHASRRAPCYNTKPLEFVLHICTSKYTIAKSIFHPFFSHAKTTWYSIHLCDSALFFNYLVWVHTSVPKETAYVSPSLTGQYLVFTPRARDKTLHLLSPASRVVDAFCLFNLWFLLYRNRLILFVQ